MECIHKIEKDGYLANNLFNQEEEETSHLMNNHTNLTTTTPCNITTSWLRRKFKWN